MVYNYISCTVYQSMLGTENPPGLFYEGQKLLVSLLRVNKLIHDDVRACLAKASNDHQIILLCMQDRRAARSLCTFDLLDHASRLAQATNHGEQHDSRNIGTRLPIGRDIEK